MKLMIASDLHGSAYYTKQLLEAYERETPEKLLLLGDILYHGPRNDLPEGYAPKEVIALLNPGSVSIPKGGSWHGYMTLENGDFRWLDMDARERMAWRMD